MNNYQIAFAAATLVEVGALAFMIEGLIREGAADFKDLLAWLVVTALISYAVVGGLVWLFMLVWTALGRL